ncbi:subtilisin-like protease SBT2.5 [Ananas comosus]|uniref:Subtilisin-like protease SBT2.5 n=1 Tax=Ananas comosus TaxID=4615 RepID=A0A6P5FCM3_ANACO|nr:subtilisin-like protease SBT2.5 [Ananas comosus]
MALIHISCLILALIDMLVSYGGPAFVAAKVYMVVMEDEPVISYKARHHRVSSDEEAKKYKEEVIIKHDIFLESLLPTGSYTKLYSYTHLLNGFALYTTSEEAIKILNGARGVRAIHEDVKMKKMTTHTPDYIGVSRVWPGLGGAKRSGDGVVIGMIDTGINPNHPSFASQLQEIMASTNLQSFRGSCEAGDGFPTSACNGKIVGAQFFARAAMASGEFNATRDYASPFDSDGHGSHTASIAAGNYRTSVSSKGYNYGYASGMAPGARIAVYKAVYSFGGYMSDVVAAVDKAVEDGVDILNLSIGPSSVPHGAASFLDILEVELLLATKAGVSVIQAVGNGGPDFSSVLSFSPWIMSVAASITDRKYNNSIALANGQVLYGIGLSPPTTGKVLFPIASAGDLMATNSSFPILPTCNQWNPLIPALVRGKLIICAYIASFDYASTGIHDTIDAMQRMGAAGVIIMPDHDIDSEYGIQTPLSLSFPAIVLQSPQEAQHKLRFMEHKLINALQDYYNAHTVRGRSGAVISFGATGRICDGRRAFYTRQGPIVASYSSRGPGINNNLYETADVLKPNILAPGSTIWAAWSPKSQIVEEFIGENFAMLSGTSMASPHISGVAALIKQKHPDWSPAAIASAMMTTADTTDRSGARLSALANDQLSAATPFDYGAGAINAFRAVDPGLVFDADFNQYMQFLCSVPGVDDDSVRRAVGSGCPTNRIDWCSDLNAPSVTVANLMRSRVVLRRVRSVSEERETYTVAVQEPEGVKVSVVPRVFEIAPNRTRALRIVLKAREVRNTFSFGELVLSGDKEHVVRVPLAVLASSTLKVIS